MGGPAVNRKKLIIAVSLTFTVFMMIALQNVQSGAYSSTKEQIISYVNEKLNNSKIKQEVKEESEDQLTYSISKKVVRFHVIANSDSDEDQAIKLKIRDAILEDLGVKLEQLQTKEESILFLKDRLAQIENIANTILRKSGKFYSSKAYLQEFDFPIKSYGEITLPQGKYTALRVVLGNGEGKNWWCVMFPPLCFIDITRGLASEESNMELGKVLDQKEISKITTQKSKENNKVAKKTSNNYKKSSIQVRFKTIDFIKSLL